MTRLAVLAAVAVQAADLLSLGWALGWRAQYLAADANPVAGLLGSFPLVALYKGAVTTLVLLMVWALIRLGHPRMATLGLVVTIVGGVFATYTNLR